MDCGKTAAIYRKESMLCSVLFPTMTMLLLVTGSVRADALTEQILGKGGNISAVGTKSDNPSDGQKSAKDGSLPIQSPIQQNLIIHAVIDKPKAPDAERLAYAERLYASDKFEQVKDVTLDLLRDISPLATEAQFLRGKAMFALNEIEPTRMAYEWLVLRYPDSQVVRDGRLAKALSKAAMYLFDRRLWRDGGKYLALLQQIDGNEVAGLALRLEGQLDWELAQFTVRSEGRERRSTADALGYLSQAGSNSCLYNSCYVEDDQKCQAAFDEKVSADIRGLEESRERDWRPKLEKWFGQQRKEFANQLAADIQTYPLLSQLAREAELVNAMIPPVPPAISSPYRVKVENTSGSSHRNKYDWNNSIWEGKKTCIEVDPSRLEELVKQLTLRFGRMDRDALLHRLGLLIGFEQSNAKPRGPKL